MVAVRNYSANNIMEKTNRRERIKDMEFSGKYLKVLRNFFWNSTVSVNIIRTL